MKRILLLLMFGLGLASSKAQTPISIDDTQTVQQLIEDVLVLGNCAEVNNITSPMNSSVAGLGFESFGAFDGTGASPAFPFDSGIVLASNGVNQIVPGNPAQNGGNPPWLGDPDLEILAGGGTSSNATIIEFEFIPFVEEISFNYFLASNEWPTFVCGFADTFAFILSGPGIPNVNDYNHDANPNTPDLSLDLGGLNIATLPGTNIPVNPTNIHDLTATCGAGTLGEFAVPQLYDDAGEDDGTTSYFGRTLVMPATAQVIPGQTYTIKLAISDYSGGTFPDTILDSAVFIESASFDLGGIDLGPDLTIVDETAPCEGDIVILDAGFSANNIQYFWAKDGTIIPGENDQTLEVTEPGVYEVGIQIGSTGAACFGVSNAVTVEFYPEPQFAPNLDLVVCEGETLLLDGTPTNADAYTSIDYQWFKDGVVLIGQTDTTLEVNEAGVYEIVVDANACDDATNTFNIDLVDYEVSIADPMSDCIEIGSSVTLIPDFNGSLTQDQIDNEVTYEWTTAEGTIFNTPTLDITEGQEVTLTTTFEGCDETTTQTFTFFNNPVVNISGAEVLCQDETITLDATPENVDDLLNPTYTWFNNGVEITGESNPTIEITDGGTYQVIVNNNGCETQSLEFDVELVDYQVTFSDIPEPCIGSGETVTVGATFEGLTEDEISQVSYQWSTGEDTPSIELTEGQEVTLTTTFNGCEESVTETFSFFSIPELNIAGADVICGGETNTLNATPLNLNDLDEENLTYTWSKDGVVLEDQNTALLDITDGGVYEVTVVNNGCEQTAQISVELVDYSVFLSDTEVITLCSGTAGSSSLTLTAQTQNLTPEQQNQIFYTWSDGSDGESITVSESGTYFVETDVNGCVEFAEVEVLFIETIQVTLSDAVKCPGDSTTLQAQLQAETDPGVTYLWFSGSVVDEASLVQSGSASSLVVEANETGQYTVVVDNQGCLSNPVTVTVSNYEVDNCRITQGLSPDVNNDGKNDCMDLTWLSDESGIKKISVFNRYGRKVFEENNYVDTFCGQDENGNTLSTGTYFYVIELERESERLQKGPVIKGWVYVNAEQ